MAPTLCLEPGCDRARGHGGPHMTLTRAVQYHPKETRAGQVLRRLREAGGGWVDGSELATAEVGGSEGLKRLRELRAEGWPIEERRHPDPRRAVWQYRLPPQP